MDREQIGALLKQMRVEAGLTQEELARRLRRTSPYVSKIERGTRGIELAGIARWARACGAAAQLTYAFEGQPRRAALLLADEPVGLLEELAGVLPRLDPAERRLVEEVVRFLSQRTADED